MGTLVSVVVFCRWPLTESVIGFQCLQTCIQWASLYSLVIIQLVGVVYNNSGYLATQCLLSMAGNNLIKQFCVDSVFGGLLIAL